MRNTWSTVPTGATAALHAALASIGAASPVGFRQEVAPGVVAYATGAPMMSMNGIALDRARVAEPVVPVGEAVARLHATKLPWSLQIFGNGPRPDEDLKEADFVLGEASPTYVRSLSQLPQRETSVGVLEIAPVETAADRDDFAHVLGAAFGADATLGAPFVDADVLAAPLTFAYLGREHGIPVVTGMTVIADEWAGLFAISTADTHRRRGYGELMTLSLCDVARANGARAAYLQASSMGLPLYERIGFRDAADDTIYRRAMPLPI